ncbi:hypothetical protein VTK56DRAFT_5594 [Thermocarpiscus australiensis]
MMLASTSNFSDSWQWARTTQRRPLDEEFSYGSNWLYNLPWKLLTTTASCPLLQSSSRPLTNSAGLQTSCRLRDQRERANHRGRMIRYPLSVSILLKLV